MDKWHFIQINKLNEEYYIDGKKVEKIKIGNLELEFGESPNFLMFNLKMKETKEEE